MRKATLKAHLVITRRGAAVRHGIAVPIAGDFRDQRRLDAALCADAQRIQVAATNIAGNQVANHLRRKSAAGLRPGHARGRPERMSAGLERGGGLRRRVRRY